MIGCLCGLAFRKRLEETIFTENYLEEVTELFKVTLREYLDMEKKYDKETNHMKVPKAQKKWQKFLINRV